MLYLLCHLVHSRKGHGQPRGCSSTAWTEYVGLLPRTMPVPTMWSEDERLLLKGTSLEVSRKSEAKRMRTYATPCVAAFAAEAAGTATSSW